MVEADGVTCLIDNAGNMGIQGFQPAKNISVSDGLLGCAARRFAGDVESDYDCPLPVRFKPKQNLSSSTGRRARSRLKLTLLSRYRLTVKWWMIRRSAPRYCLVHLR